MPNNRPKPAPRHLGQQASHVRIWAHSPAGCRLLWVTPDLTASHVRIGSAHQEEPGVLPNRGPTHQQSDPILGALDPQLATQGSSSAQHYASISPRTPLSQGSVASHFMTQPRLPAGGSLCPRQDLATNLTRAQPCQSPFPQQSASYNR